MLLTSFEPRLQNAVQQYAHVTMWVARAAAPYYISTAMWNNNGIMVFPVILKRMGSTIMVGTLFIFPLFTYNKCSISIQSDRQMPCDKNYGAVQLVDAAYHTQSALIVFVSFMIRTIHGVCYDLEFESETSKGKWEIPKLPMQTATYLYHITSVAIFVGYLLPTLNLSYGTDGEIGTGSYIAMALMIWNAVCLQNMRSDQSEYSKPI